MSHSLPVYSAIIRRVLVCLLMVSAGFGITLTELRDSFEARYDEEVLERGAKLAKLEANYLAALERQMKKTQISGDLEAVIPFRSEIEVIKGNKEPLPQVGDNAGLGLKEMRRKYLDARQNIFMTHARTLNDLAEKMDVALVRQMKILTKAGSIDEALKAKEIREALTNDEEIMDAKNLLKLAGLIGEFRPAMRLRRFGDDIEVLVYYDASNKISMKSLVENVREETGGSNERGDTKATMLGEFVGAKGFKVDPLVSYHQVYDENDLEGFSLGEITANYRHKEDGNVGVRLSLVKKPTNPHGSIKGVLPPVLSKGTFRITTHYFVPRSNKEVLGFRFIHGAGNPIGMRNFEDKGKWSKASVIAASTNKSDRLLFYFNMAEGKNYANAQDDYVVLQDMKVEQLKFSAYVCYKLGDQGKKQEESDDALKQALFILNGKFAD